MEMTIPDIPCFTMLDSPIWTITHKHGTNTLVGSNRQKLIEKASDIIEGKGKKGTLPQLWDGKAEERIVDVLVGRMSERCEQ